MLYLNDKQLDELEKCCNSPVYLLYNYGYLSHPSRGKIPFDLYPWQEDILCDLADGENIIAVKSRQIGMSWLLSGYGLWIAGFHPNKDVLFVSRTENMAISLIDKVKFFYKNMPKWLIGEVISETRTQIVFGFRDDNSDSETYGQIIGRSKILSSTTTSEAGRGGTYGFILGDEVAFWPDRESEAMWRALGPTVAHGGQTALCSTPNGLRGALFDRLYFESIHGKNTFKAIKVHWKDCGFDDEWYKRATRGMTKKQILQELECDFIGSGSNVFDLESVQKCYDPNANKEMTGIFYTGVDSAEGRGSNSDFHAAVVLNEHGVQVEALNRHEPLSRWAGQIAIKNNVEVLQPGTVSILHEKFPGPMVIESNSTGMTVYKLHKMPKKPNCRVMARSTNMKSKPAIVNQLALALESGKIVITDPETFAQLMSYSYNESGKMSAPLGQHDDLVMALCWAYEALVSYGFTNVSSVNELNTRNTNYAMANKIPEYETARSGLGTREYGTTDEGSFFGSRFNNDRFRSNLW